MRVGLFCVLVISCTCTSSMLAQTTQPAPAASSRAGGRWDEISDRVVFLTRTLATVEASLTAIDKQIRQTGYKAVSKQDAARTAAKGNELMSRNLGMPASIDWKDFYGRTAQRFFYHPTGPRTYYINPIPIADRPPQFDFLYKANQTAMRQAEADAAALAGKTDLLIKRRNELEGKQLALWTQIPFESVAYQEVTDKPLYRFELKTIGASPLDKQKLAAAAASAAFVRDMDRLMSKTMAAVTRNPSAAFKSLESESSASAKHLQDALLAQDQLASALTTPDAPLQQVAAAAKRSAALARNVADAQELADESSAAGEEQAKTQYRAVLQTSLIDYAAMAMVVDSNLDRLAKDWNIAADTSKPSASASASASSESDDVAADVPAKAVTSASPSPAPASDVVKTSIPPDAIAANGHHFKVFWEAVDWNEADQRCKDMGGYMPAPLSDGGVKFFQHLKGKGTVVWLGAYRSKTGWLAAKDGHQIKTKLKAKIQPGDQAIVLTADGTIAGRPFSGVQPAAKIQNVQGFICAWDE